jgi:hypothetical protein
MRSAPEYCIHTNINKQCQTLLHCMLVLAVYPGCIAVMNETLLLSLSVSGVMPRALLLLQMHNRACPFGKMISIP